MDRSGGSRSGGRAGAREGTLERRLHDLQREQGAQRTRVYTQTELDELRACKALAYRLWGDGNQAGGGLVEADAFGKGMLAIGRYLDPPLPGVPNFRRRRKLFFRGASYAELLAQVRFYLWRR